jgi:hypothetical protein
MDKRSSLLSGAGVAMKKGFITLAPVSVAEVQKISLGLGINLQQISQCHLWVISYECDERATHKPPMLEMPVTLAHSDHS